MMTTGLRWSWRPLLTLHTCWSGSTQLPTSFFTACCGKTFGSPPGEYSPVPRWEKIAGSVQVLAQSNGISLPQQIVCFWRTFYTCSTRAGSPTCDTTPAPGGGLSLRSQSTRIPMSRIINSKYSGSCSHTPAAVLKSCKQLPINNRHHHLGNGQHSAVSIKPKLVLASYHNAPDTSHHNNSRTNELKKSVSVHDLLNRLGLTC